MKPHISLRQLLLCYIFLGASMSCVSAQPYYSIGAGVSYGTDFQTPGVNLRAYINTSDKLCFGPEFTWFSSRKLREEGESFEQQGWEMNFNGHYIFSVGKSIGLFPLFGFNLSQRTRRYETGEVKVANNVGLNLGAGVHYELGRFEPVFEVKYITGGGNQFAYTLGLFYFLGRQSH